MAGYSFFSRRTFMVGQTIEMNGVKGKIISVSNLSVIIQNGNNEKIVIPSARLIENQVKIFE